MIKRFVALLAWLVHLFAPPPLASMSYAQKIGRIFLFTVTMVVISILLSMVAAVGIFALEHARRMAGGFPELAGDIGIIFVSMLINAVCVIVLLEIRKADRKLIPPRQTPVSSGPDHK